MTRQWLDRLLDDQLVVLDGGTGSELRRRGVGLRADVWSALAARENEALLREIHIDFIRAGADIITTNTFATTRFVLAGAGLADDFELINRRAVAAARAARDAAADRPIAIAGSMSCFPPRFDPDLYPERNEERDAYREHAALLAAAGVDLIALEMIQDIEHGALALGAALGTGLPVSLGLSVRRGGQGLCAYDNPARSFESVLGALLSHGPTVVAIMHTPIDAVSEALAAIADAGWTGPLGAYPELETHSAGEGVPRREVVPAELAAAAVHWVRQGVRLLGGCCGARPSHIAALAEFRDARRAAGLSPMSR